MPLGLKHARVYAEGFLTLVRERPTETDRVLTAFVALIAQRRHLRYAHSIVRAIDDALEAERVTFRIHAESAYALSERSMKAVDRFLTTLPNTDVKTVARARPGIHLTTSAYHWDGRLATIVKQLHRHLNS